MSNNFASTGNLATQPKLETIKVDGKDRRVANMRIYFPYPRPLKNGGFEDKGGFFLSTRIFGKNAEHVVRICRKGAMVVVQGSLVQDEWTDKKTQEPRSEIALVARTITLHPAGVDSVAFRESTTGNDPTQEEFAEESAEAGVEA